MYMFTLYSFVYTALARACTIVTPIRTHTHSLQLSPTILMDGCPPVLQQHLYPWLLCLIQPQ